MATTRILFLISVVATAICNSHGFSIGSRHISGNKHAPYATRPEVFDINLYKNNKIVRTCKGSEISTFRNKVWITAADCLDEEKYDKMEIYFHSNGRFTGFSFALPIGVDSLYSIHPQYNKETKHHNLALISPLITYMNYGNEVQRLQLPNKREDFVGKTADVFQEWKNTTKKHDKKPTYELYTIQSEIVDSSWCNFWYRSSPMKENNVCVSGWYWKGLNKNDVGIPLVVRETNSIFRLVGISTKVRPWAHVFGLPMEFLDIRPYMEWIRSFRKTN